MYQISIDVGTKNLAFCVVVDDVINKWEVITLPTTLPAVIKCLDNVFTGTPDMVIIEKQPSRNIKMRVMEQVLAMYFLMRGVSKVEHYSPKHKLGSIGKQTKGKTNYSLRKKYSVAMCRSYLEKHQSEWTTHFEKHKKKDDLADSLLQWIAHSKHVPLDSLSDTIVTMIPTRTQDTSSE